MNKEELLSIKRGLVNASTLVFKTIANGFSTLHLDPEIHITNTEGKYVLRIFMAQKMLTVHVQQTGSPLGQRVRAVDLDVETLVDILNRLNRAQREQARRKFHTQTNIGLAKYVVSVHDGVKMNEDGSPFYGIRIFSNKRKLGQFEKELIKQGYTKE